MTKESACIFDIQRFSLHDGPGIRTVVFVKGCPLNCLWCHNPESKSRKPVLVLRENRCLGCGACVAACPHGLHAFGSDGVHTVVRQECTLCGACVDACVGALSVCGRTMTVDEVLREVEKDNSLYVHSGGGLTLSGGEPLAWPTFTGALLKEARARGLHTCLETCGMAPWAEIEALLPWVDLFLYDVKEKDSERHRACTGVSNEQILENLQRLDAAGASIVLRCPIIPGYNDRADHLAFIGQLANTLSGVLRVDIEPYHPLGRSKSREIGAEYSLNGLDFPTEATVASWVAAVSRETTKPVTAATVTGRLA